MRLAPASPGRHRFLKWWATFHDAAGCLQARLPRLRIARGATCARMRLRRAHLRSKHLPTLGWRSAPLWTPCAHRGRERMAARASGVTGTTLPGPNDLFDIIHCSCALGRRIQTQVPAPMTARHRRLIRHPPASPCKPAGAVGRAALCTQGRQPSCCMGGHAGTCVSGGRLVPPPPLLATIHCGIDGGGQPPLGRCPAPPFKASVPRAQS